MDIYSNGGYSVDFSKSVMNCSLYKLDNAYYFPNIFIHPRVCKTNLASNTSMRGYGGPQVVWFVECIMNRVAHSLDIPIDQVNTSIFPCGL